MYTSLGYHTFSIALKLTVSDAIDLYHAFKKCTEVRIRSADKEKNNVAAFPKGYFVEYFNRGKGITWFVRFDDKLSHILEKCPKDDEEPTPYSVRAKINPKVLVGVRDYLTAANSACLASVESQFNIEAAKFSPILGKFEDYSMNRADYCLNVDLKELKISCSPKQMMILIKRGDIPSQFTEWTEYDEKAHRSAANQNALYLENKSVAINYYWKHAQLLAKFPDFYGIDVVY